jgi:hypothetical protein
VLFCIGEAGEALVRLLLKSSMGANDFFMREQMQEPLQGSENPSPASVYFSSREAMAHHPQEHVMAF